MGRAPCCDKANVKKGPWSPEEDTKLKEYIEKYGTGGNWIALPQKAGLRRCGKSCRLRWLNYLRPNIKHGEFTEEEDSVICSLYATIGSRWSIIAAQLPGRTDNDIKNYWNTKLKKKLLGLVPNSHKKPPLFPSSQETTCSSSLSALYKDCNPCYIPTKSFIGLESSLSFSSNLLSNNSNYMGPASSFLHSNDSLILTSPMQQYYNYHAKDNTITAFASEGSCSSSDGSCSQISSREIKQEDHYMGMHSYNNYNNYNNGLYQESQKFVLGVDQNVVCPISQNGFSDQPLVDYDLENFKNKLCNGNVVGASYEDFIFNNGVEENKSTTTQEKIMSMMYNYY